MHMLDPSGNKEVKMELDECKENITANLQRNIDIGTAAEEELRQLVGPAEFHSLREVLMNLYNPRTALQRRHETMGELLEQLEEMLGDMGSGDEKRRRLERGQRCRRRVKRRETVQGRNSSEAD